MEYFQLTDSLFDITERYPVTIKVFADHGFVQLMDEEKRTTLGKALSLDIALSMREIDHKAFCDQLVEIILHQGKPNTKQDAANTIRLKGLLPCPVRLPLQESLDSFLADHEKDGYTYEARLKAASMGLDWMKEEVKNAKLADELDDVYVSAGFDMFFETAYFGRFFNSNEFFNPLPWSGVNAVFEQDNLQLNDPLNRYGIIAVVPAVFLVNTTVLGDRPIPDSWASLLDPIYAQSVSLPVSDFDLFNAILLTLDKTYGREAISKLGRNMLQSLHPAQMVKSDRSKLEKPAITIMPYFFTKMAKEGGVMKAVWPKDGAIISPIFMIGKSVAKEKIEAISTFLASEKVAEILAHQGLFPSLHPEVDNRLLPENKFLWLGWDYIAKHDLNQQFEACHAEFNQAYSTQIA